MRDDWVSMKPPEDEDSFPVGKRVIVTASVNNGRTGTVVSWGRSRGAQIHYVIHHAGANTCTYGATCDYLVDSEGPVIRYDDQDPGDESLDWYPGQSLGCLKELSE